MSNLSSLASSLFDAVNKVMGGMGSLTRGGVTTTGIPVNLGRPSFSVDGGIEPRVEAEDKDLLVKANRHTLNGVAVVPAVGDVWKITLGGQSTVWTYEVMEPPYKPSPDVSIGFRIHGKRTG